MSLSSVQRALAHIYTDRKLRDDFLINPDVVGRTLKLNCVEIQQLSKLSSQSVNMFASSLKYKRLGEIHKLLPLTTKALGNDLNKLFFTYSETFLPNSNKKHLQDAIAFATYILNMPQKDFYSDWIKDILLYERMRLQSLLNKKSIVFGRFNYNIRLLIHSLSTADSLPNIVPQKNITIWYKLPAKHQWYSWTISLSFDSMINIYR